MNSGPTNITTFQLPGMTVTDLTVEAPLTPAPDDQRTIEVFARVVAASSAHGARGEGAQRVPMRPEPGSRDTEAQRAGSRTPDGKPFLVFLQGGPGNEAPRPAPGHPPWLARALKDYRVVMLDQRGTGRSTPVFSRATADGHHVVSGPLEGMAPKDQAEYLTHMRADGIVRDAELVRRALGVERWTLLGQSFGGFTSLRYLSEHPDSLAGVIITGGLPPVGRPIEDVYTTTWRTMIAKSEEFYRRFPEDRERMRELARLAAAGEIVLRGGRVLSPEVLRTIGSRLGMQGGMEEVHYLLGLDPRSAAFAHDISTMLMDGRTPLYSVVHESCYADGGITNWAGERTMPEEFEKDPTLLAGEHIHHLIFQEDPELRPFADAADILAAHNWDVLYDRDRLAGADVPVAAAIYADDAYVPREYSLETAALLADCRVWVTSEYEHNGLRMGPEVLDHLIGLLTGDRWR